MRRFVLDSWAIMAWLKSEEPAAGTVRQLLDWAELNECRLVMNIMNLGEVFYLSVKARDLAFGERVLAALRSRVQTMSAADDMVLMAAELKSRYAISYADAFAAATAMRIAAPLVTGDPDFPAVAAKEERLSLQWIGDETAA